MFDHSGSIYTWPWNINAKGLIAGYYEDGASIWHGFTRDVDGTITSFDPRGSKSTFAYSNNATNQITGNYVDKKGLYHGFLRTP